MYNMKNNEKVFFYIIAIQIFSLFNLFSIDIYINDNSLKTFDGSDYLYNVYPPIFDIWEISLTLNNESKIKKNINIEAYSKIRVDNHTVKINEIIFDNVKTINIKAELIKNNKLEVWIGWEGTDLLKKIISDWGKNNNIDINVINATNVDSRLKAVYKSNTQPADLVLVADSDIMDLYNENIIQSLPKDLFTEVNPMLLKNITYKQYYAIPFYYDVQLLFYNPKLIKLDQYTKLTLQNLENEANKIINKVDIPLSWNSYSLYWLLPIIYSYNSNNIDFSNNLSINNLPTLNAITYLKQLNEKPYFKPLEKNAMLSYFINGKTAAILSSTYSIPYFDKLKINYEIAPLPINDITNEPLKPLIDSKVFVIPKGSYNTILSYRLIQYLESYKVQKLFCESLYKLSSNKFVEQELINTNSYYQKVLSNMNNFETIPNNENYQSYKNILWKLLRFVYTNQLTPEQVIIKGEQLLINNNK